jgi:hypothetical protein
MRSKPKAEEPQNPSVKKAPNKKRKIIRANVIHLVDSTGKLRILLDAEEEGGSIAVFANGGKSIQISTGSDGSLSVALFGKRDAHASLTLAANETTELHLSGRDGKLGAMLGEEPDTLTHRLFLFKDGQLFWTTPTGRDEAKAIPPAKRTKAKPRGKKQK